MPSTQIYQCGANFIQYMHKTKLIEVLLTMGQAYMVKLHELGGTLLHKINLFTQKL